LFGHCRVQARITFETLEKYKKKKKKIVHNEHVAAVLPGFRVSPDSPNRMVRKRKTIAKKEKTPVKTHRG